MEIFPAIDLYQGKVVRLTRGEFQKETVYSTDPSSVAKDWERQGARWIHVVDLEGAKNGVPANLNSLRKIREAVRCKIEFGGGVRDLQTVRELLTAGVDRAILGTRALDETFLKQALQEFGAKIAVSLDAKNGTIQTEGWLKASGKNLQEMLTVFNNLSLATIIYTDIHKDGMLAGPNFPELARVLGWAKAKVILSGGISALKDLENCRAIGNNNFEGVIVGKALYDKKFTLAEALQIAG